MKSIKCLVLLGLLVASVSARPGIIDSLVDTIVHPSSSSVAESSAQSKSRSLGGNIGFGPFGIGGNLNSASSRAYSSASAVNSAGYRPEYVPAPAYRRIGGSHAAASAESETRSIGGGIGFGPFNVGGNFNSARSEAHSSASAVNNNNYDPVYVPEFGSVSQAHAQAEAQAVAGNRRRYY